jgi:D-alanine-D-alanine ligase
MSPSPSASLHNTKKRVAVLMGGISAEREVSLTTGAACAKALDEAGYQTTTIDVGPDLGQLLAALAAARPEVVFNALHGRFGEDGAVQGLLDLQAIPYTHSGVLASALAMDKPMAKRLFAAVGIPVPEGRVVAREELFRHRVMDPPYVVKPTREGSSVGVKIVQSDADLEAFKRQPWPFDPEVIVERYVPGRELSVAVMGDRALGVVELVPLDGFYDYEHKYTDGRTQHLMPAPIPPPVEADAKRYALLAHRTLGCRGVTRADFRYDDTTVAPGAAGELYMLEINTQPGMTPLSLVPEIAKACGISFQDLVGWMVENAACERRPA